MGVQAEDAAAGPAILPTASQVWAGLPTVSRGENQIDLCDSQSVVFPFELFHVVDEKMVGVVSIVVFKGSVARIQHSPGVHDDPWPARIGFDSPTVSAVER